MLIINGKMMLRVDDEIIKPGEKKKIPDKTAEKLLKVGLVEKAVKEAPENATMPKTLTVKKLKKVLKDKGLPTYGTKEELLERLEGD